MSPLGSDGQPVVRARARSREDRAGDPLDGLVNLFDLGIVLSLAFLLAALSSLELTPDVLGSKQPVSQQQGGAPEGSVIVRQDETVRSIDLRPGERVVGRGEPVGTVYRLADGRTVIVQDRDAAAPDAGAGGGADAGATPAPPTAP